MPRPGVGIRVDLREGWSAMALGWDKETYGKAGNAMARGLYDQFILQSEVYSLRREGVMKKESLVLTQGKLSEFLTMKIIVTLGCGSDYYEH